MQTRCWLAASLGVSLFLPFVSCGLFSGGLDEVVVDASSDLVVDQSPDSCPTAMADICGGRCVDLRSDPANCGMCGMDCTMAGMKPMTACVMGSCIECDPMKINFQTDPAHCGRCGHSCLGGTCVNGNCQKQLLYAILAPAVLAVDSQSIYFNAGVPNIYRLDKKTDGGSAPVLMTNQLTSATRDIAPFSAGLGIAHQNGASLIYFDGGPVYYGPAQSQFGGVVANDTFWWTTSQGIKNAPTDGGTEQLVFADLAGARAIVIAGSTAFWTNVATQRVMRGDPGDAATQVATLVAPSGESTSYRLVLAGGDLVWTEASTTNLTNDGRLMRVTPDGAASPLATAQGNPQYLAYDGVYVYWTNRGAGTVSRIKADGSEAMPKLMVANATEALGIAVDSEFVYFTQATTVVAGGGVYRIAK